MSGGEEVKPAAPGVKLTYEDFLLFPDDGKRHEQHPIGRAFNVPLDSILSDFDVVEPDLQFISRARHAILTKQNVRGAPDLVVEVGSPGTRKRDETIKRRLCERVGVSEYWIVDPELDTIKVYRRVDERYIRTAEPSLVARERRRVDDAAAARTRDAALEDL